MDSSFIDKLKTPTEDEVRAAVPLAGYHSDYHAIASAVLALAAPRIVAEALEEAAARLELDAWKMRDEDLRETARLCAMTVRSLKGSTP